MAVKKGKLMPNKQVRVQDNVPDTLTVLHYYPQQEQYWILTEQQIGNTVRQQLNIKSVWSNAISTPI